MTPAQEAECDQLAELDLPLDTSAPSTRLSIPSWLSSDEAEDE